MIKRNILISLVLFFFCHAALADLYDPLSTDGKTYPATFCQYWGAPKEEHAGPESMLTSQYGRIINDSDEPLGVVCPIVRDSMQGYGIARVKVWGIHHNCENRYQCAGTSYCVFRVMNMAGQVVRNPEDEFPTYMQFEDADNNGTAVISANWEFINNVPAFTSAEGVGETGSTFVLFCMLDPDAELSSYYVGERVD